MVFDDKKDIRLVGYGILGSAIVALIYDVVPIIAEKGLIFDVIVRMLAFSGAIVIGILSILIFPKIKRMKKGNFAIIIGTACGIAIGAGILWILLVCRQTTCLTTGLTIGNLTMWGEIATLLTSIATLGTLVVLIKQTGINQKQSRLAYGPVIIPRYIWNNTDNKFHILLFNVGKGHALDIDLQFKDKSDNPIGRKEIQAYALLNVEIETYNEILGQSYTEKIDTGISFSPGTIFSFKITGWYRDAYGDKIKADREYEYPPKFV